MLKFTLAMSVIIVLLNVTSGRHGSQPETSRTKDLQLDDRTGKRSHRKARDLIAEKFSGKDPFIRRGNPESLAEGMAKLDAARVRSMASNPEYIEARNQRRTKLGKTSQRQCGAKTKTKTRDRIIDSDSVKANDKEDGGFCTNERMTPNVKAVMGERMMNSADATRLGIGKITGRRVALPPLKRFADKRAAIVKEKRDTRKELRSQKTWGYKDKDHLFERLSKSGKLTRNNAQTHGSHPHSRKSEQMHFGKGNADSNAKGGNKEEPKAKRRGDAVRVKLDSERMAENTEERISSRRKEFFETMEGFKR